MELTWVDTLNYAGYNNWRLPNISELLTLSEKAYYGPAINLHIYPNVEDVVTPCDRITVASFF